MAQLSAGSLRTYFRLIASKVVRDSEVNPERSNSHEFNGTEELRELLGRSPFGRYKRIATRFLYLSDYRAEPVIAESELTWYKTHRDPKRSEWRWYYKDNAVVGRNGIARKGDLMVFAFSREAAKAPELNKHDPSPKTATAVWSVIARRGSVSEREVMRLFGIGVNTGEQLVLHVPPAEDLDAIGRQLLDGLGIELRLPHDWEGRLADQFGEKMPDVATFSDFAASTLDLDYTGDPDRTLVDWWEREDLLFRVHDRCLMKKPLKALLRKSPDGDDPDIEAVRALIMSSTQKARSRAGGAFEHQLEAIFRKNALRFDAQAKTGKKDIPDFLFPSLKDYERSATTDHLTMLAAKTTCKERWTQVLHEAPRIPKKHLATISPAIPPDQLARMRDANLTLVIPKPRHSGLPAGGAAHVITLQDFIHLVRGRQAKFS